MLAKDEDLDGSMEEGASGPTSAKRKPSGPRAKDPYEDDDSSSLLPVFVAIGAALPLLFCLCKLWFLN